MTALVRLVAWREYLRTVRRRGFVIGTLLLPLGLGALLVLSTLVGSGVDPRLPGSPGNVVLLVANESDLAIPVSSAVAPDLVLVTRADGLQRLETSEAEELYVVPATYPDDPTVVRIDAAGETGPFGGFQRQAAQEQQLAALLVTTLLDEADVPPDISVRIVAPLRITAQTPDGQPVPAEPSVASFLVPFAFTMLFVLSIFITSGYLLQSVTEEKENRVVEIILSSVPALPLMAGKIIGLGGAGLTQVVVWIVTGLIATSVIGSGPLDLSSFEVTPTTLVLGLLYFALGYLAYGAIFSAVGAVAPGSREAQQYAGFFGFLAVVPLIFTGIFLTDPSSPIVTVLALVPFTTPAAMLLVLSLTPEPPWPLVVASLTSLTVFTVLATVASARVFRATLLLYGVRPSLSTVVAAVFART